MEKFSISTKIYSKPFQDIIKSFSLKLFVGLKNILPIIFSNITTNKRCHKVNLSEMLLLQFIIIKIIQLFGV